MTDPTTISISLQQEDQARADLYALIARLLLASPDAGLLASLAGADSISSQNARSPLDRAWEKLVLAAGIIEADAIEDEYQALFVSIAVPKINPYASLYLSGFINEKPLAALRTELAQLQLARAPGVGELEDHLGALCETMRMLITGGRGGRQQPLERQQQFFEAHIAPWFNRCLDDIRAADEANFYRLVADFIQAFLEIEAEAFDIEGAAAG
jgi:TorA maturation chaperone TorD